jgi:hypothetical protein
MLTKNATLEPLGLVLKPNKLAQYPDGAELVALGSVHNGAGICESAPAFETAWAIDAGSPILRAEIIPTNGYTLALLKIAAGWRYSWIDGAGTASALATPSNAYTANVDFEIDGRVNWTLARDRVWVTSTTGVMVFDYISPTTDAERAPRLAGMFTPAITATPVTAADAGALKNGEQAHLVAIVVRHFPDCYEAVGSPTAAVQVAATSADANIQLTALQRPGHPQIIPGDTIEVYRTIKSKRPINAGTPEQYDQGTSTQPDYFLSSTYDVPNPVPGTMTWTEATGDQNLGTALYTNAGVQGGSAEKRPPPICRAIANYRDYIFYFDVTEPAVRVTRASAGMGELTDTYSQTWGVGTRPGPAYDSIEINGVGFTLKSADELASTVIINVDDLNRVNPDTPGEKTTPATGFGFRFDYAGAGDFTVRASHGANYQPPLPTLAQTAESVTRPRRKNGMAWTEKGQPEAVTQYGVVSNGIVYAAVATSDAMVQFTSEGVYLLTGSGGSSSAGFDWGNSRRDSQTMLRGPKACCRLGDIVYAATNNGVVAIDSSGLVKEISTSALGLVGVSKQFSQDDRTTLIADEQTGDIYCAFDGTNYPYVYSTRWNKWSRVQVAPGTIECAANVLGAGMVFGYISANTLQAYHKSLTNFQEQIVRFQPNFCDDQTSLKRFAEIEFYFNGSAFGQLVTLLINKMQGLTRTLREHEGATTPSFIQAGIDSSVQGDTAEFSLAQTAIEVPREAPCVSNSISFGFITPAGTVKYVFYGAVLLAYVHEKTVRRSIK